ncbi:alpha/beta hydrolase [Candidatus Laterigemmans baculatus]|uniref:alpha/beta hydrolase n=1 Tax=Candidatus Laterigemmans baculatus TaxID=2770505 RepID=UPI0013D908DF|nr:alpha/beta hydrolase [Candidatus Laterigemmans baculatus]
MNPSSDAARFVELTTGARGDLPGWLCSDPRRPLQGGVVLVHGLGEHSGRYRELAGVLAGAGFATLGYDQQGHGLAPGRRGAPRSYDSMLEDIDAARRTLGEHLEKLQRESGEEPQPALPQWLFGHSMGGNLAVNYALRWPHDLAGLILSSPMLMPAKPPSRSQVFAAWLTGRLLPFLPIRAPIDPSELTHDPAEVRAIVEDPLHHARFSLHLATQMLAQGRWSLDRAGELKLPVLVFHGELDSLTDPGASETLSLRAGEQASFHLLPGMYHETLHELEREKVFAILREWLEAQKNGRRLLSGR